MAIFFLISGRLLSFLIRLVQWSVSDSSVLCIMRDCSLISCGFLRSLYWSFIG